MRERKIRQITRTVNRLEQHIESVPSKLSQGELKQLFLLSNRIAKCQEKLSTKRVPDEILTNPSTTF